MLVSDSNSNSGWCISTIHGVLGRIGHVDRCMHRVDLIVDRTGAQSLDGPFTRNGVLPSMQRAPDNVGRVAPWGGPGNERYRGRACGSLDWLRPNGRVDVVDTDHF